jgi:hypothetical protein
MQSPIKALIDIVTNKARKLVKFENGSMTVDLFTASAILAVYNSLKDENKLKFNEMIKTKQGFIKLAEFALKNIANRGN